MRAQRSCGSRPGRKPQASARCRASRNRRASDAGSCASLPKAHRTTADVVPPTHDRRVQRQDGVDLEGLAGSRHSLQGVEELGLELRRVEGAVRGLVPRADGVVDVGEDLEGVIDRDHGCDIAQVGADDVRGRPAAEELTGLGPALAVGKAVQGAEDPVEGAGREDTADGLGVQVRLAEARAH